MEPDVLNLRSSKEVVKEILSVSAKKISLWIRMPRLQ